MNTLAKIHVICAIMLASILCTADLAAQTLSVFNVNTSEFPKITADYMAFDAYGSPVTGLTAADFTITETPLNGTAVNLTPTITHDCIKREIEPEASILIILDRSNSMRDEVNGMPRFKYAQQALTAFVNKIRFIGETRVILTTFAGTYEVATPWTNDPSVVTDTLQKMEPQTVTNYELPFEGPGTTIYDLFKQRPANIPRYVFFLTDGHPNPSIANEAKFVTENIARMQSAAIRFFSVTIMEKTTHHTLESFAKGTGGKAIVTTEKDLVDLFSYLALETQIKEICQISWISPFVCVESQRSKTALIRLTKFTNTTNTVSYTTPPRSVAGTNIDMPVLFCGDPPANQSSQATVTIEAVGAPLSVTGFAIVPNQFFKVVDWGRGTGATFTPFTLPVGQKLTIRVEFTQGAQQTYRQSQLQLTGSPCPPNIELTGGQGVIRLNTPKGGELFSTCDTVFISWTGVLPETPVRIEYSADGGSSWKNIIDTARGLHYKWVPPAPGNNYRIRVSVAPVPQYQWVNRVGDTGIDSATSVAISSNDLYVYTTGWFDGPFRIGETFINNQPGNIDGYMGVWDANGNLLKVMHLRGNDQGDERVMGVVTDTFGNIYVAGYHTASSATFDGLPLNKSTGDISNMFIFKFNKDLELQWKQVGTGFGGNISNANCTDIGLRYDANGYPIVVVRGKFARYVMVGYQTSGNRAESNRYTNNTLRDYYATYDANGNATFSEGVPPNTFTMKKMRVDDRKGFSYETGSFTGVRNFAPPTFTVTSRGASDIYLFKFGSIPASSSESPASFVVSAPELSFTKGSVSMDPTAQGQSSSKSFPAVLCNTGDFEVELRSAAFSGQHAADYALAGNLRSVRLKPGECLSVEVVFTPSGVGQRTAVLEVLGTCNTIATLTFEGEALAPCLWDVKQSNDLGRIALGVAPRTYTITQVLCNKGPVPLSGTVSATGSSDITITAGAGPFSLAPNACHDITVSVAPNTAGVQTMRIDFGLAAECGVPVSTVIIEVVEPKVAITDYDFGRHRVGNIVNGSVFIENQSTQPVTITDLTPEAPTDPNIAFDLTGLVPPLTLAPGERREIPVTFNPQSRGAHRELIYATITGQQAQLTGTVTGVGFLPAITATGYDFPAITVNQTAVPNGFVVISNVDSDSPLHIQSVNLAGTIPDFSEVNWPTFPTTLNIGEELRLEVTFTPSAAGFRSDDVIISHDAKAGPEPIPPYATTIVKVTGTGIEQSALPPLTFNDVLTCARRTATLTITNPNPSTPLQCAAPVATGDITAFSILPNAAFVINPGESQVVTVEFTPPAVGTFNARFSFQNNQALDLIVNATGRGITTPATFTFGQTPEIQVGKPFALPILVNIGDMQGVQVTGVELTLTVPKDFLAFNQIIASQAGWTFTGTVTTPGVVSIVGTPDATATLNSGLVATAQFDPFLTAEGSHTISMAATVQPSCVVGTGESRAFAVSQVCYSEGRLISIGRNPFSIASPQPNPAESHTSVLYTTGIKLSTTFEIIDNVGNVVRTITTPVLDSGEYVLDINTSDLSSGIYILRMTSGPFVKSTVLSVVR